MKKRSLSTVKKELDRVFSEFIRKRDADLDGYITCVSCKKKVHWKDSNCCHFVDRQHMATRYDETNCNAGCVQCNAWDKGFHIFEYQKFLDKKYGPGTSENLMKMRHFTIKFSVAELEEKIKLYKQVNKEI